MYWVVYKKTALMFRMHIRLGKKKENGFRIVGDKDAVRHHVTHYLPPPSVPFIPSP